MSESVYVIFDDVSEAARADRALSQSRFVPPPQEQAILCAPLGQDFVAWSDSRAAIGALIGASVTAVFGALVLGLATASGALAISMPTAMIAGLVGGAVYGLMLGAIAGSTEPKPKLRRVRARLERGQAALMAKFNDPDDAAKAQALLMQCRGAKVAV